MGRHQKARDICVGDGVALKGAVLVILKGEPPDFLILDVSEKRSDLSCRPSSCKKRLL